MQEEQEVDGKIDFTSERVSKYPVLEEEKGEENKY
jgi:hypothetical protein